MSNLLVHPFVSAKSDTADATLVQPSNWNDGHKFTGGSHGNVLMRDTSDTTYGASWIANANNAVLSTNGSGVPSWVTTLPTGVQDNITRLGTIAVAASFASTLAVTGAATFADSALTLSHASAVLTFSGATAPAIDFSGAAGLIKSVGDLVFQVDRDNNGTNTFQFKNGAGTAVVTIAEGGDLTITGSTTTPLIVTSSAGGATIQLSGAGIATANLASDSGPDVTLKNNSNGRLLLGTNNTTRVTISAAGGMTIGSPTGGDKGAGTLNATAVYDDNVLLTDWVFDLVQDGRSAHPIPAGGRLYTLDETRHATAIDRRLPWMPTRAAFEEERHLGGMVSRLWFGQEQQQVYLQDLHARIAALETPGDRPC